VTRVTLAILLLSLIGSPARSDDEVPDVLSDEGILSLESVEISTSPPRATLAVPGRPAVSLTLGTWVGEKLLTRVSSSRMILSVGGAVTTTTEQAEVVLWDQSSRRFLGLTTVGHGAMKSSGTGSLESEPAVRPASSPIHYFAVLTGSSDNGASPDLHLLVRMGGEESLVSRGDVVGGLAIESMARDFEPTLIVEEGGQGALMSRERTVCRESVAFVPSPSAGGSNGRIRVLQEKVCERVLDEPSLSALGQSLHLLSVIEPDKVAFDWRGDARLVRSKERVGPFRVDSAFRVRRPADGGRLNVEQHVTLFDLFGHRSTGYRITDHYRGGRFEFREDPMEEHRPVLLGPPVGGDGLDLGF